MYELVQYNTNENISVFVCKDMIVLLTRVKQTIKPNTLQDYILR